MEIRGVFADMIKQEFGVIKLLQGFCQIALLHLFLTEFVQHVAAIPDVANSLSFTDGRIGGEVFGVISNIRRLPPSREFNTVVGRG